MLKTCTSGRMLLCLAAVLVAPEAGAAIIQIVNKMGGGGGLVSSDPAFIDPLGIVTFSSDGQFEVWNVPVEFELVGVTQTLNAANATSLGVDWDRVNDLMRKKRNQFSATVTRYISHTVSPFNFPGSPAGGSSVLVAPNFNPILDRVEWTLLSLSITDRGLQQTTGVQLTQVFAQTRLVVYANVPEPSTAILFVIGALILLHQYPPNCRM